MNNGYHAAIIGHALFPQGLLSAAESIVGKQDGVITISNENLGGEDLVGFIEKKLAGCKGSLYIFVDLVGGSTFNACRMLLPVNKEWKLLAGVNLPMLVTYLSYRTRLTGDALFDKTLEAGRRGMDMSCINNLTC